MLECTTKAVVLWKQPLGECDTVVALYTEQLGRVEVRATSARKITSKLSAHLEPGFLTTVRLARRASSITRVGRFQVTDALREHKLFDDFLFLDAVSREAPPLLPDADLWEFLLQGAADIARLQRLTGSSDFHIADYAIAG